MRSSIIKVLTCTLICLILLSGCTVKNNIVNDKEVTIATSFYPIYIMAINVAKDIPNIKVVDMTKPIQGCLHDYAFTPNDLKNIEGAQFLIINGAGMESFMDKIVIQQPNLKIIDSSKGIKLIKSPGDIGYNPHLWVSITNAIQQVRNIGEQLSFLDPDNAEKYKSNTEIYIKKLESERVIMHEALDKIVSRDIITFHEAFPYFAKEFNLNVVAVIEREPGSEPSAKEIKDTIAKIKSLKVKVLFAEPQYSQKAAQTIALETGAKVYYLDPAVTGPLNEDAYLDIMKSNLKVLQEALK